MSPPSISSEKSKLLPRSMSMPLHTNDMLAMDERFNRTPKKHSVDTINSFRFPNGEIFRPRGSMMHLLRRNPLDRSRSFSHSVRALPPRSLPEFSQSPSGSSAVSMGIEPTLQLHAGRAVQSSPSNSLLVSCTSHNHSPGLSPVSVSDMIVNEMPYSRAQSLNSYGRPLPLGPIRTSNDRSICKLSMLLLGEYQKIQSLSYHSNPWSPSHHESKSKSRQRLSQVLRTLSATNDIATNISVEQLMARPATAPLHSKSQDCGGRLNLCHSNPYSQGLKSTNLLRESPLNVSHLSVLTVNSIEFDASSDLNAEKSRFASLSGHADTGLVTSYFSSGAELLKGSNSLSFTTTRPRPLDLETAVPDQSYSSLLHSISLTSQDREYGVQSLLYSLNSGDLIGTPHLCSSKSRDFFPNDLMDAASIYSSPQESLSNSIRPRSPSPQSTSWRIQRFFPINH